MVEVCFGRAPWRYTRHVDPVRQEQLQAATSFEELLGILREQLSTACRYEAGCDDELRSRGCRRAVFTAHSLDPESNALDLFFNSPVGYRAQYYVSVIEGERANAVAIAALRPRLLDAARQADLGDLTLQLADASLSYKSAKIWINTDALQDVTIDGAIEAPTWQIEADGRGSQPCDRARVASAAAGLLAPIPAYLEIFGAWLDRNDQEYVMQKKQDRSIRLHKCGWV